MPSRIQEIEEKIMSILTENNARMNDALKDPLFNTDPSKLTILMNMNLAALAEVHELQREKIAIMLVDIKEANSHLNNQTQN